MLNLDHEIVRASERYVLRQCDESVHNYNNNMSHWPYPFCGAQKLDVAVQLLWICIEKFCGQIPHTGHRVVRCCVDSHVTNVLVVDNYDTSGNNQKI